MSDHRGLKVLELASAVSDDVSRLIDNSPVRLIHVAQLRDSAQAVPANIAEGFGRRTLPQRNERLYTARGEAEETIRHLRANLGAGRIKQKVFWDFRDRCVTIVKMLNALLNS